MKGGIYCLDHRTVGACRRVSGRGPIGPFATREGSGQGAGDRGGAATREWETIPSGPRNDPEADRPGIGNTGRSSRISPLDGDCQPDSRQQILFMSLAVAATLPGVYLRITGIHPDPILAALLYGMAIVGAAFILSWAAEVIQLDIAAGLALALLALIAILPEYAVDFVFTAQAGQEFAETGEATQYGPLALANMTGGNQLLIGLGWPMVILIGTWRVRRTQDDPGRRRGRPRPRSTSLGPSRWTSPI